MITPITVLITVSITFLTTAIVTSFLAVQRYEHSEKKWVAIHQQQPETINLTSTRSRKRNTKRHIPAKITILPDIRQRRSQTVL